MDLVRFGVVIRALRRRRGWRQLDLANSASVSQTMISLIERGHGGKASVDVLIAVAGAHDARVKIDLRWRGGELDRLIDADHGVLVAAMSGMLRAAGWDARIEVTYAVYGASGSIDILAWHEPTRTLLVIEIKTEVTSGEATVRKLDEKARLGGQIARERFGWHAASVSRLLVIEATSTARRRVERASAFFASAFPVRVTALRRWLRNPSGSVSGLWFLASSNPGAAMSRTVGRHRVRTAAKPIAGPRPNVVHRPQSRTILTNRS